MSTCPVCGGAWRSFLHLNTCETNDLHPCTRTQKWGGLTCVQQWPVSQFAWCSKCRRRNDLPPLTPRLHRRT